MTAKDVAEWMLHELNRGRVKELVQIDAAELIHGRFGKEFADLNANGRLAIKNGVLKEFKKLHGGSVLYVRRGKLSYWTLR